jgi:hypothetical protein
MERHSSRQWVALAQHLLAACFGGRLTNIGNYCLSTFTDRTQIRKRGASIKIRRFEPKVA